MRLSDIALHDYDWMRAPPSPSAASLRIARHQREVQRDMENALAIPRQLRSRDGKIEAGYSSEQELALLDLEAKQAAVRAHRLETERAKEREQDARDAEMLRTMLASRAKRRQIDKNPYGSDS